MPTTRDAGGRAGSRPVDPDDRPPRDEVLEIFRAYDRNHSGSIDRAELAALLEALGAAPSEEELQIAVEEIDRNGSGKISWQEFRDWWRAQGR
jgi:Ca2+-binding EF-hand superfamily protein